MKTEKGVGSWLFFLMVSAIGRTCLLYSGPRHRHDYRQGLILSLPCVKVAVVRMVSVFGLQVR